MWFKVCLVSLSVASFFVVKTAIKSDYIKFWCLFPSTTDPLSSYSLLLKNRFDDRYVDTFSLFFAEYFITLVRSNDVLDKVLQEPIKTFKFICVLAEIKNMSSESKAPLVLTNAKRRSIGFIRILMENVEKYFSDDKKKQIESVGRLIIEYFDWSKTIFLLTHSNTFDDWVERIKLIRNQLSTVPCDKLMNSFELLQNECEERLLSLSNPPVLPKYSSKLVKFDSIEEIISFFMDNLEQIHMAYPNFLFTIDSSNILAIDCKYCNAIHSIESPSCILSSEIANYFSLLTKVMKEERQKAKKKYETKVNQISSLALKLQAISRISYNFFEFVNKAIYEMDPLDYPKYSVDFIRSLFVHSYCCSSLTDPLVNYATITESLYQTLLTGKIELLNQIDINNFSLSSANSFSFHLTNLFSLDKNDFTSKTVSFHLINAIHYCSNFYLAFKFIHHLADKFKEHLRKEKEKVSNDESCCSCCMEQLNETYVSPFCSCSFLRVHVSCFANQMLNEFFRCKRCKQSIGNVEPLKEYINSYNMSLVDKFDVFSVEEDCSNSTINTPTPSNTRLARGRRREFKDINDLMTYFSLDTKNHLLQAGLKYLLKEKGTLENVIDSCQGNSASFLTILKPYYKSVVEKMELFLNSAISQSTDQQEIWEAFKKQCWDPITELKIRDLSLILQPN